MRLARAAATISHISTTAQDPHANAREAIPDRAATVRRRVPTWLKSAQE
jgi:hypothetical protein